MKVLLIGLQYFSHLLANEMQLKYPEHRFISLNTYYSNKDRLKYLYHILSADIVHSINGTVEKSHTLELAFKLNKKVIMHWVGTDYVNSKILFDKKQHLQKYLDLSTHITVSPWYVNDMKSLGIDVQYAALKGFDKEYPAVEFEKEFRVLCYISQSRPQFYGMDLLIEIANKTPEVHYDLVGIESYDQAVPKNVFMHGWIDNVDEWIKKSVICLRFPKTDGLSFFVLESIVLHRYVAYNLPFKYSDHCQTANDFINYIEDKKHQFDKGELNLNTQKAIEINEEFNQEKVLEHMMTIYNNALTN